MWKIISYNDFDLTDGYSAMMADDDNPDLLPTVEAKFVSRGGHAPASAGIERKPDTLNVTIKLTGTDKRAAFLDLTAAMRNIDGDDHALVARDREGVEWSVQAKPVNLTRTGFQDVYKIRFSVADRIWVSVDEVGDVWDITASGQTKNLGTSGNVYCFPTFKFKPTALKTTGLQYGIFRAWRNPNSIGQAKRLQDLTNDAWNTAALVNDTSVSNQVNNIGGYDADDLSIAIDTPVGVGLPAGGGMCYCARTGEQIRYSSIAAGVMTVAANGRGWAGTTAAALLNNDVLTFSYLRADGADIRVFMDDLSVPRWVRGANTSTTQVFANVDWDAGISLTLKTAIASSGDITEFEFVQNADNLLALQALELRESNILFIGTEGFTFDGVISPYEWKVTGEIKRAQFSSSMAAHAANSPVYWIQHKIWIGFGNPDLEEPTQDETEAPLHDLDNTTNLAPKFLLFKDKAGLRSGLWNASLLRGLAAEFYLGSHATDADPATEAGMSAYPIEFNGGLRPDSYDMIWSFYDMAGITHVTMNGESYRYSISWPTLVGIQRSNDGIFWGTVYAIPRPSVIKVWTAWSQTSLSLSGTYKWIGLRMMGSIAASISNAIHCELQTATLTLNSSNVPQLVFSGAVTTNMYELDCKFINNHAGIYFQIHALLDKNEELEVNCAAKSCIYLKDNTNYFKSISMPKRSQWMVIDPAVVTDGLNEFQFDDAGTTGLRITSSYYDRRLE